MCTVICFTEKVTISLTFGRWAFCHFCLSWIAFKKLLLYIHVCDVEMISFDLVPKNLIVIKSYTRFVLKQLGRFASLIRNIYIAVDLTPVDIDL